MSIENEKDFIFSSTTRGIQQEMMTADKVGGLPRERLHSLQKSRVRKYPLSRTPVPTRENKHFVGTGLSDGPQNERFYINKSGRPMVAPTNIETPIAENSAIGVVFALRGSFLHTRSVLFATLDIFNYLLGTKVPLTDTISKSQAPSNFPVLFEHSTE